MLRWRVAGNDETRRRPRLRRRSRWRTGPATSPSTATRATTARRASTDSTSRSSGGTRTVGGEGGGTAATRTESRAESPRAAAARRISSEDSDSDSDSDSDDATPLEPLEGDRARRVFVDAAGDDVDDADGIHVENENDARIRAGASSPRDSPDFPETFFPETRETRARGDFPARRRAKQTRLDAWGAAKAARRDASSRFARSRDRRQTTTFYCADGKGQTSEASRAKKRRGRFL